MKALDHKVLRYRRKHQNAKEEGDKITKGWNWLCEYTPIYFPNHRKKH